MSDDTRKRTSTGGTLRHIFSAIAGAGEMLDPLSMFVEEASRPYSSASGNSFDNNQSQNITKPSTNQSTSSDFLSAIFGESVNSNTDVNNYGHPVDTGSFAYDKTYKPNMQTDTLNKFIVNSEDEDSYLLSGEEVVLKLCDVSIPITTSKSITMMLHLTNYRIILIPSKSQLQYISKLNNPSLFSWLSIPLMCIERIEKDKKNSSNSSKENHYSNTISVTIIITCKDIRQYRITFDSQSYLFGSKSTSESATTISTSSPALSTSGVTTESLIERTISLIARYAFPNNHHIGSLFAVRHYSSIITEYVNNFNTPPPPQRAFDIITEFMRQGVTSDSLVSTHRSWRFSFVNNDYKLCTSYPQILLVPTEITDEELFVVAGFRCEQRLPVMTWSNISSGASLWRSSQPKAGMSGSCSTDEKYLDLIARSCNGTRPLLLIIDCRNVASAMANRAAGAGYESSANYPNSRLEFLNIGNIHTMRESYKSLSTLVLSTTTNDVSFGKLVEETMWLTHVRMLLKASWDCANGIHRGNPVLVHCSHGWDRTSQVCSLAELFLDPFYRTIEGFQVLIEKEWVAFGHPFRLRSAHGLDRLTRHDDQTGPIFLQFLDCVWQLVHQHPYYFEFSSRYILLLASHIYSCRFGTFLCDNDLERDKNQSRSLYTLDVWSYLHSAASVLRNPLYLDPKLEDTPTANIFLPPLQQLLRNVTLWTDFFFRYSTIPSLLTIPEKFSNTLYDGQSCRVASGMARAGSPTRESTDSAVLRSPGDTSVPALTTSHDLWEAAYRQEKARREFLEKKLLALGIPLVELEDRGKIGKMGSSDEVVSSSISNPLPVPPVTSSNREVAVIGLDDCDEETCDIFDLSSTSNMTFVKSEAISRLGSDGSDASNIVDEGADVSFLRMNESVLTCLDGESKGDILREKSGLSTTTNHVVVAAIDDDDITPKSPGDLRADCISEKSSTSDYEILTRSDGFPQANQLTTISIE